MFKKQVRLFFKLIKVTVTLPVTFLVFAGCYFYSDHFSFSILPVCLAVFLLAGAASALNQVLEVRYDAIMERTQNRPIPSGKISKINAIYIALILAISGSTILLFYSIESFVVGVFTLVWYLLGYTLLKRVTAFAIIPGSLTGALPPIIGWTAVGGHFSDYRIVILATLVFIWQIPHFWLLMLIYGDEYKKAGFPVLFDIFSEFQVRLWTLAWIVCSCISVVLAYIILSPNIEMHIPLLLGYLYLGFSSFVLLFKPSKRNFKTLFHIINLLMLGSIIILLL
jgi:protoheme IX farnesyltransferase